MSRVCEYVLVPAVQTRTSDPEMGDVTVTATAARKCRRPAATVDYVNGFRCDRHPPRWDRSYARLCREAGRPGAADAYRRTMIALLRERATTRLTTPEGEAA